MSTEFNLKLKKDFSITEHANELYFNCPNIPSIDLREARKLSGFLNSWISKHDSIYEQNKISDRDGFDKVHTDILKARL